MREQHLYHIELQRDPHRGGDWIWFNSVAKLSSPTSGGTEIFFTSQTITFSARGTTYTLHVPDSEVMFSTKVTEATTVFQGGAFVTTVPAGFGDNVFHSGLAFLVPPGAFRAE